jgi:hypothetical protein
VVVIKKEFNVEIQFDVTGDSEYYFNDEYAGTVAENACINVTYMKPGLLKIVNDEKIVTIYIDESFDKNVIIISKNKGKLIYTISTEQVENIDRSIKGFVLFIILLIVVLVIIFAVYLFMSKNEKAKKVEGNYTATNTNISYTSGRYKYFPRNMTITFKSGMYSVNYDMYGCIQTGASCTNDQKVDTISSSGTYTFDNDTLYLELGNGTKRTCKINTGEKTTIDCTGTGGWYYTKK